MMITAFDVIASNRINGQAVRPGSSSTERAPAEADARPQYASFFPHYGVL